MARRCLSRLSFRPYSFCGQSQDVTGTTTGKRDERRAWTYVLTRDKSILVVVASNTFVLTRVPEPPTTSHTTLTYDAKSEPASDFVESRADFTAGLS